MHRRCRQDVCVLSAVAAVGRTRTRARRRVATHSSSPQKLVAAGCLSVVDSTIAKETRDDEPTAKDDDTDDQHDLDATTGDVNHRSAVGGR